MTKQYKLDEISEMIGIDKETTRRRLRRIDAQQERIYSADVKAIICIYSLSSEEIDQISVKKREFSPKKIKKTKENLLLDSKLKASLIGKQRHWMYSFGFAGKPKINAQPSYINKGVIHG